MSVAALTTALKHGGRTIRFGGLPFFFATLMTGLGLYALAAFATLLWNFERVAERVGESVAAVAFLNVDDATAAEETRARLQTTPGVRAARLVSPDEALARARRGLGEAGKALEGSVGLVMPWVVEVTPRFDAGIDRDALVLSLQAVKGVDEVMHPGGEVKRVGALMGLLHGAGVFLVLLLGLVVVVVTSNAVKLTVFARKDEIAIMKLVGATDLFVRAPFLLSGLAQGVLGATLALLALLLSHASLAGVVRVALSGALGTFVLDPLPPWGWLLTLLVGATLGLLGAVVSVGRFLRV
jgi:cell division transport system permease protein